MNEETIADVLKLVDRDRMESRVRELAQAPRNAFSNPHHLQWARSHVGDALRASGCGVTMQQFPCGNRTGVNIIGSRPGSNIQLRPLLVSAHYDTTQDSPGADDNASGLAGMLECAAVLQVAPLKRPVEFVAFDMEEAQPEREGLVGSSAFVSYLEGIEGPPVFEGLYNLEMVGYTSGPGGQGASSRLRVGPSRSLRQGPRTGLPGRLHSGSRLGGERRAEPGFHCSRPNVDA